MYTIRPNNEYGKAIWALYKGEDKIAVDDDRKILAKLAALMVMEASDGTAS